MNILITGASRGIGAELAFQLAREHHHLLLLSRDELALKKLVSKCNEVGGSELARYIVYDLRDLSSGYEVFIGLLKKYVKSIDVLVNNAGAIINKPFVEISAEESKRVFEVNYFAAEQMIKTCLPFLQRSDSPSIVNITSMGAVQGSVKFPGLSSYSASKGALAILTECLAEEFKEMNIKVNALAFGAVQTEMLEEAFPGYRASTTTSEMVDFLKWFVLEGWKRFNGKMLPVSESTP